MPHHRNSCGSCVREASAVTPPSINPRVRSTTVEEGLLLRSALLAVLAFDSALIQALVGPGQFQFMADAASPDLAAADLLAGFALGAPLQNPEAGPVGQLASGHSNGGGNAARGKDAQEGGAQPGSECGNGVRGDPAAPPPFADAAAAVQQAMVMVQREQVNFAFRDGLGKRGRKNKEAEADRIAERKRAQTEAAPLIAPILQPATEHMPPGAPDAQTRQGVPFIPQPSVQLLPQVTIPRLLPAPKSLSPFTLPPPRVS